MNKKMVYKEVILYRNYHYNVDYKDTYTIISCNILLFDFYYIILNNIDVIKVYIYLIDFLQEVIWFYIYMDD